MMLNPNIVMICLIVIALVVLVVMDRSDERASKVRMKRLEVESTRRNEKP